MKTESRKAIFKVLVLVLFLALGSFVFAAQIPDHALNMANPRVREIVEVQEAVTPDLMLMEDVLGTAVGQDDDGEPTILVLMNLDGKNPTGNSRKIPREFRGARFKVEFTEPFRAFGGKAAAINNSVSHTAKQTPPVQLGTSGGWGKDSANGYCCGGTLGSLIQFNGSKYVLSNYHVFESDIVAGGNNAIAATGDSVIQPGLIDVGCLEAAANQVASLVKSSSLPNNSNVDASIALANGLIDPSGSILEIGTISSKTVKASLRKAVKKSGRTTGLTRSAISGVNASISVIYDDECAGAPAFTKIFTGQILVSNKGSMFLNSGDSGSLMVEDVATNPRAVGLLFAGSSTLAVANPIDEVLAYYGKILGGTVGMVGQ